MTKHYNTEAWEKLSYRARALVRELERLQNESRVYEEKQIARKETEYGIISTDELEANMEIIAIKVFETLQKKFEQIVLKELRRALRETKEFNAVGLAKNIEYAFSDPDLLTLDISKMRIDIHPELVAGTWQDYIEGIQYARMTLGLSGKNPPEKRAWIWKNLIYRPAREGAKSPARKRNEYSEDPNNYAKRKYLVTMRARIDGWNGTAPYWIPLNYGNPPIDAPPAMGAGSDEPAFVYPRYGPTHFVERAREKCQMLFSDALNKYINKIMSKSRRRTVINTRTELVSVPSSAAVNAKLILNEISAIMLQYLNGELGDVVPGQRIRELLIPTEEGISRPVFLRVTRGRRIGVTRR